ncbi:hypothetical protein J4E86_003713 [Alternaria arbusti]|uniref:uncharacterized protein n=1 Tax=Alternaria arbusti TaxID=232088 RepID=UPI00221FA8F3|nr:uncharacterized protein J4E86_003713 [Alternaria arbusti]KAI4958117.1 hypothetical protein J4E86_003713 [Alternaria arbusti]
MAPISTQTAPKASATADPDPLTSTNALAPTTEDTAVPDAPLTPNTPTTKKRKRKDKPTEKAIHILHQTTFRKTSWSYFHLILLTPGTASLPPTTPSNPSNPSPPTPTPSISPLLTSTLLTAPLRAYLGTTGTAIPIDTLKIHGCAWVPGEFEWVGGEL